MPERFEIYIVYKRRYINTLPFLSFLLHSSVYILFDFFLSLLLVQQHQRHYELPRITVEHQFSYFIAF